MAFRRLGSLQDIPPENVTQMEFGTRPLAVCRVGDAVHVIDGTCPHAGGPLGYGALHHATLVCPLHGWEFDCTTGRATFSETLRVACFPVRVEGDDILIDID